MKKKYFNLFLINSIIPFAIFIVFFALFFIGKESPVSYAGILIKYYLITTILIAISIALFVTVLLLARKKYTLDVNSLLLPISNLIFTFLIIIVSLILNYYVVVPNMHYVYYYKFILISYILLSSYTILSFKK